MDCPVCNGRSEVIDSRKRTYGVWRRRKCLECGSRFTTQEVLSLNIEQASRKMGKLKANLKRFQDSLDEINNLLEANDE